MILRIYRRQCLPLLIATRQCRPALYSSASSSPATSLLSSLRTDLKTAMRDRDTARLSVLRSLLAEITNASKTSSPITNDIALLALLRKRLSTAKQSINAFSQAGRQDLVVQEQEQLTVLNHYASAVDVLDPGTIQKQMDALVDNMTANGKQVTLSLLMKTSLGPAGYFTDKPVDKAAVAEAAKQALAAMSSSNTAP